MVVSQGLVCFSPNTWTDNEYFHPGKNKIECHGNQGHRNRLGRAQELGRQDRVEKMDDYAAFGIRWYWLVDPELRSLEIFELGADGRYARALGVTSGRVTSVPGCEGLEIDVDNLWTTIDGLDPTHDNAP